MSESSDPAVNWADKFRRWFTGPHHPDEDLDEGCAEYFRHGLRDALAAQAEQIASLQSYNQKQADKIAELERELTGWKQCVRNRDATVKQQGDDWVKLKTEIDTLRAQLAQATAAAVEMREAPRTSKEKA